MRLLRLISLAAAFLMVRLWRLVRLVFAALLLLVSLEFRWLRFLFHMSLYGASAARHRQMLSERGWPESALIAFGPVRFQKGSDLIPQPALKAKQVRQLFESTSHSVWKKLPPYEEFRATPAADQGSATADLVAALLLLNSEEQKATSGIVSGSSNLNHSAA